MAGRTQGFRAGVRGAARYGLGEKTGKVAEAATPEGSRGRAVHVRRFSARARAHESQCVIIIITIFNHLLTKERNEIDLEAHGGLYTLHSHINHSCSPNISVRHVDQRTALSRITMIAKRDIAIGEELLVTYVNPSLGVHQRRSQLGAWGLVQCDCTRCIEEEKERQSDEGEIMSGQSSMDELERELKAGLGVI